MSASELFAISRERSVSAPDVYRSRIISGHAPLVSTGAQWLGGEITGNRCNCGRFAQRRFAPCKVFCSRFHAVPSGFQTLDSRFQLLAGFLIHWAEFRIFQSPGFRIPLAKISQILDSISKKLKFFGFRNLDCRTRGKTSHPDLSWLARLHTTLTTSQGYYFS